MLQAFISIAVSAAVLTYMIVVVIGTTVSFRDGDPNERSIIPTLIATWITIIVLLTSIMVVMHNTTFYVDHKVKVTKIEVINDSTVVYELSEPK